MSAVCNHAVPSTTCGACLPVPVRLTDLARENDRLRRLVAVVAAGVPREDLLRIERAVLPTVQDEEFDVSLIPDDDLPRCATDTEPGHRATPNFKDPARNLKSTEDSSSSVAGRVAPTKEETGT